MLGENQPPVVSPAQSSSEQPLPLYLVQRSPPLVPNRNKDNCQIFTNKLHKSYHYQEGGGMGMRKNVLILLAHLSPLLGCFLGLLSGRLLAGSQPLCLLALPLHNLS